MDSMDSVQSSRPSSSENLPASGAGSHAKEDAGNTLRRLRKKLREIAVLRQKQTAGEALDDGQLAKLASLGEISLVVAMLEGAAPPPVTPVAPPQGTQLKPTMHVLEAAVALADLETDVQRRMRPPAQPTVTRSCAEALGAVKVHGRRQTRKTSQERRAFKAEQRSRCRRVL